MKHQDALAHLNQEIARTRAAMQQEAWAKACAPAALALGTYLVIGLFGLPTFLPPLAASLAAMAILLAITLVLARGLTRLRPPSLREARARLANEAKIEAGMLDALEDSPSRLDPGGVALWHHAQAGAQAAARAIRARRPHFDPRQLDPFSLRYVLLAGGLVGALLAGPQLGQRLYEALVPDPGPVLGDRPLTLEAWAVPAAYTGAAPIALSDQMGKRLVLAPRSEITVRVAGPVGAPILHFDAGTHSQKLKLRRSADGAYEGRIQVQHWGVLRLVRFHEKARWRLLPKPDAPPQAKFESPLGVEGDQLRFAWSATDDYGVEAMRLRLSPVKPPPGLVGAKPLDVPLDGLPDGAKTGGGEAELSLLAHAYAGMEVQASIVAVDAFGQEGVGPAQRIKLPAPIFLQPLARAAIEIRAQILHEARPYQPAPVHRALARFVVHGPGRMAEEVFVHTDDADPRLERAPSAIRNAARKLEALTAAPQDGYFRDLAVFAGLRGAGALLAVTRELADLEAPAQVLWDVANRAEYGDSADARRALEEAKKALAEALRNGADAQEIAALSRKLQEAARKYVEALRQEALRENRTAQSQESQGQQQTNVTRDEIEEMLKEVQRLAEAGQAEAAAALLERIAALLENLQVQLAQGPGEGQNGSQGQTEKDQGLDKLSEAIGGQRALNDDTRAASGGQQAAPDGQQGGQTGGQTGQGDDKSGQGAGSGRGGPRDNGQSLAERQKALQQALEAAKRLAEGKGQGQAAQRLGQAGQAMTQAENALRQGDFGKAQAAQDEALGSLRSGAEEWAKALRSQADAQDPKGQGVRDPLGRNAAGGVGDGTEIQVPQGREQQRSREILQQLRQRASDPNASETERAYLRRLLDQFEEAQ